MSDDIENIFVQKIRQRHIVWYHRGCSMIPQNIFEYVWSTFVFTQPTSSRQLDGLLLDSCQSKINVKNEMFTKKKRKVFFDVSDDIESMFIWNRRASYFVWYACVCSM